MSSTARDQGLALAASRRRISGEGRGMRQAGSYFRQQPGNLGRQVTGVRGAFLSMEELSKEREDNEVEWVALSNQLTDLSNKELSEQADFWVRLASEFGPWKYTDPRVDVDAVVRFFDGTMCGVESMLGRCMDEMEENEDDLPSEGTLHRLLASKYGFLHGQDVESATKLPAFQEFCKLVLKDSAEDGSEASQHVDRETFLASLCFAVRHLRIGALLSNSSDLLPGSAATWQIYYYNYDGNSCEGSLVPSRKTVEKFSNNSWVEEPMVEIQMPCGAEASPGCVAPLSLNEFFMKHVSEENITHWAHAHNPSQECILALGQHYRLRVHSQCLLARLESASPQVEYADGLDWSSVVFPAVYVDKHARRAHDEYLSWLRNEQTKAEKSGRNLGGQKKFKFREDFRDEPRLHIGVVRLNLMIFWSATSETTVVSVASAPKYFAKWSTPSSRLNDSMATSIWSWCCCRRRAPKGYQPIPQEESSDSDDLEAGTSLDEDTIDLDNQDAKFRFLQMQAQAEECTRFEDTFGQVLVQLAQDNSVLRMGSYSQLVYRILLNRSIDYLYVLSMYEAAIGNLEEQLAIKGGSNKAVLINRVSTAKLELEAMVRVVEPFFENVLPKLPALVSHNDDGKAILPTRVCRHYKFDMQNNFDEFLRKARTQIKLCDSLVAEYDRKSKDQVNSVLNYLTMVMFVILPMQILTGLYGMNFKHMPELEWQYGYHYFFTLAACVTALTAGVVLCVYQASLP